MKEIFLVSLCITGMSVACKPSGTVAQTNTADPSSAAPTSFSKKVCSLISANPKTFQKAAPSAEGAKRTFCGGLMNSPEKATLIKVLGTTYADACQNPSAQWFNIDNAKAVSETATKLFDNSITLEFTQRQNDQLIHFGNTLSSWAGTLVQLQWGTPLNRAETEISNLKDMACKSALPAEKKVFENLVCVPLYNASMDLLDEKTTDEFRDLGDLCVRMASDLP
jgi:hypothetical protein